MPVIFTGSTNVGFSVSSNSDTYVVGEFNTISNTGTAFDIGTFDNVRINVLGTIIGDVTGIETNAAGAAGSAFDTRINIGTGATVSGVTAIDMRGGLHTVYNNGEINAFGIAGIRIDNGGTAWSNCVIANSGTITGQGTGISMYSEGSDTINSGTINVSGAGILHRRDGFLGLLEMSTNTGTITAGGSGMIAIGLDAVTNAGTIVANTAGISSSGSRTMIQNSGDITAQISFVLPTEGIGHSGDLAEIQNTGTITADFGISLEGETGLIVNDGLINGRDAGITVEGDGVEIVNSGQISAGGADAVLVEGTGAEIINSGSITAGGATAVSVTGDGSLRNSGEISGDVEILGTRGDVQNDGDILGGVLLRVNTSGTLANSGSIHADRAAVRITGVDETVINTGEITSIFGTAISFGSGLIPGTGSIVNTGLIATGAADGITAAIQFSGGISDFQNAGSVVGNVNLTGTGTYDGRLGSVLGRVTDGDGDGMLRGSLAAENDIAGLGGNDRIVGGMAADMLDGGNNSDRISGRDGDDTLLGGRGNDTVRGGGGDDDIDGGNGNDVLFGNTGDDTISGGIGQDRIWAGAGDDVVDGGSANDMIGGGRGSDLLTGGGGNDVFVFRRDAGADVITDFTNGIDLINLRDFNTSFADVAAAASGGATGVMIDLTALGGEGSLLLEGFLLAQLNAADFIL